MKAVVYYDFDDIRIEDIPIPEIGSDEVLVRVKACSLCSTDVWKAMYHRSKPGSILGHEVSGVIAKVGADVTNFKEGERVAVYHRAQCGGCYYCRHGQEPLCSQYRQQSLFPGVFAEYLRATSAIVEKSIVKIPDDLTHEEAALIEPTACCVRTVSKCQVTLGDSVLVIGDGPLGILNAQVSKSAGASLVMVSGHHDFRIKIAKGLGIDYAFNSKKTDIGERVKELTEDRGADVVIVAVASTDAVSQATKLVRNGGKICVFGDFRDVPQPNLDLDLKLVLRDHTDLFGSWGCSPHNYLVAFDLIKSGRIKVKEMITHRFPLERFTEALEVFLGKECLKIVFNP